MTKTAKSLRILYFLGLVLALSKAFPGYIQSTFLKEFVSVEWIGVFFIGSAILSLLAINFFPYFIKKFTNFKLALIILVINIASYWLLILAHNPILVFIFFVIAGVATGLIWINMDVFVERFTSNITTGRTRTTYMTFISLGWVLSPLIVGYLVGESNYRLVYLIATGFMLVVLTTLIIKRKIFSDHIQYEHHHTRQTLKIIWHNVNLRNIFGIGLLLELFYVIAVLYIPIHLNQNLGFSWLTIGGIFTFMLVPFIVLEIPAGILADKFAGEKKILLLGFLIITSAVTLFFLTDSTSPFVWALILFLSRCGAALIEAMRESYFFKIVDVKDIDYINFFRNISPLAYLIGAGFSVIILQILTFEYIFLMLAIILTSGFFLTWGLQTIKPKKP